MRLHCFVPWREEPSCKLRDLQDSQDLQNLQDSQGVYSFTDYKIVCRHNGQGAAYWMA